MNTPSVIRIALHGLARVGKDTVGAMLQERIPTLKRVAFGDIIKSDLDALIRTHLGFSAFTTEESEKKRIRAVLVHWGYATYESVERRFFADLPNHAVNTRIFRPREAQLWTQCGGVVWEVVRPGTDPAEPQEQLELQLCRDAGFIARTIVNDGTFSELRHKVCAAVDEDYPGAGDSS